MTGPDRGNSSEQTGCELSENDHIAPAPAGQTFRGFLRDVLETVVPAIIIALLVTHFVGQFTYVQSQSMVPNLYPDHRLIIEKISYRFHGPQRGDIVVFDLEGSPIALIKRVIGLPGAPLASVTLSDSTRPSLVFIVALAVNFWGSACSHS